MTAATLDSFAECVETYMEPLMVCSSCIAEMLPAGYRDIPSAANSGGLPLSERLSRQYK